MKSGRNSASSRIDSEDEAKSQGASEAKLWLDKIKNQRQRPDWDRWHKNARLAIAAYEQGEITGETISGANLYHSNIETLSPAIYNSTPIPDIRVRFDDAIPAAKRATDIFERLASYDIDQVPYDDLMTSLARKSLVVGEGVVRARYKPQFDQVPTTDPMTGEAMIDPATGQVTMQDSLVMDEVYPEEVPWDRIIFGPARTFEKIEWLVFDHDMTKEEVDQLNPEASQHLSFSKASADVPKERQGEPEPENTGILNTIKVYECWCKKRRTLFWVAAAKELIIATHQDPFRLKGFFPVPKPPRNAAKIDNPLPQVHYAIHKSLYTDFEAVSKRINALVKQLRVRGIYDARLGPDVARMAELLDGQYVPAQGADAFEPGSKTSLEAAVLHWPIDLIVAVIQQLNDHLERIKGRIWEATGIAEAMRGNSNANKTLGATEIETQWGSMRIQSFQKDMARLNRDLLRLMVEIRANVTPWDLMKKIANAKFEPTEDDIQAAMQELQDQQQEQTDPNTGQPVQPDEAAMRQQAEQIAAQKAQEFEQEVEKIVKDPFRQLVMDIETDSTIRADLSKDMEQFDRLIASTGQFSQAIAGLAGAGLNHLIQPMVTVYASQARKYRLGREAEEALDNLVEQSAQPPTPEAQQGPSPEEQAAQQQQLQQQMEQQRSIEELKMQTTQIKGDFDMRRLQAQMETADMQRQAAMEEHQRQREIAGQKFQQDRAVIGMKAQGAQHQHAMKSQQQRLQMQTLKSRANGAPAR